MELFTITFFSTVAIFVISFYLLSLHPTISGGDSGELVAEGCILGVAHPPGYPLYTLIVHSLSKLTTSVAYIVNIFSAFCTTLSSIFMGLIVHQLSGSSSYAGSVVTIGMFCFSPLIWQYAVTAEVFPLNTLFSSIIIYLTLQYGLYRRYKVLYLGALVCGLGLCNQHTIILFEIPCILWILWLLKHDLQLNPLITLRVGLSFFIGLLPYATLPIVSFLHPKPGSWGNVTTVAGFLHHFLRKDYGTFQLFSGASGKVSEGFWERTEAYFVDAFFVQGLYIIPPLAFIGMIFGSLFGTFPTSDSSHASSSDSNTIESSTTGNKNTISKRTRKPAASAISTIKSIDKSNGIESLPIANNSDNFNTNLSDASYFPMVLLVTYLFYFIVFHSLSNLPLSDKLLYGIHQRFWMQPNVILFIFAGIGVNILINWVIILSDIFLNRKQTKKVGTKNIHQNRLDKDNENVEKQKKCTTTTTTTATTPATAKHWLNGLAVAGAVCLVAIQYQKNLFLSDQSTAYHFRQYAHALLNPLPSGSLLLINYDMQWTAVRYVQQCEHHRTDVTSINLSMMTYKWFASKHFLYPNITFPGTFHGAEDSKFVHREGAFTMYQFLNANVHKLPVFLSGKFSFKDTLFDKHYEQVPIGLVSELLPAAKVFNASEYYRTTMRKWRRVMSALPVLPDPVKYPEETWEWTIGRDFKDRVGDTAAFLLERAIPSAASDPRPLVGAVYWMESSLLLETLPTAASAAPSPPLPLSVPVSVPVSVSVSVSVHLLKNLGLAHVHLVQCKALPGDRPLPPPTHDLFGTLSRMNWPVSVSESDSAKQSMDGVPPPSVRWKEWSSERFAFAWGAFLRHPDARRDPQYQTIRNMYETATRTTVS